MVRRLVSDAVVVRHRRCVVHPRSLRIALCCFLEGIACVMLWALALGTSGASDNST